MIMIRINLHEIAKIFARYGLAEQFHEQEPLFYWEEVVGERLARIARPLRVHKGTLYIEVTSPVQARELELLKEKIIKRLNERLGEERIKELRFRAGGVAPEPERAWPRVEEVPLSAAEREEIERLVSGVEEKRLREALRTFFITERRIEKLREAKGFKRCPHCGVLHDGQEGLCSYCRLEAGPDGR